MRGGHTEGGPEVSQLHTQSFPFPGLGFQCLSVALLFGSPQPHPDLSREHTTCLEVGELPQHLCTDTWVQGAHCSGLPGSLLLVTKLVRVVQRNRPVGESRREGERPSYFKELVHVPVACPVPGDPRRSSRPEVVCKGSLFPETSDFPLKAFHSLGETHPHYQGHLLYLKSLDLNVNHLGLNPS